jgi:hypothetical protein
MIGGQADACQFGYAPAAGDFTLIAQVVYPAGTPSTAQAGLMVRNDDTAGAPDVLVAMSPGSGLSFAWRTAESVASVQRPTAGLTAPIWLKLVRTGATIVLPTNGSARH